ncbi:RIP metalloprotease RseP [Candidatus Parcubacteria bacterium]|nr:MAG: RIP metalloprotease RseP [Candidatus Parcubacteria bacterium]
MHVLTEIMFITIITFILVLSLLVFVHELGHFWVARKFGLKPKEFGFGFPPRAFGYYKNTEGKWKKVIGTKDPEDASDTIYSINWLPLGGFVNLEEDEDKGDDPNHFSNKPIYQRTLILIAGVSMNIILAAVLISVGYMIGLPQTISDLGTGAKVSDVKVQVLDVAKDSPAEAGGVEAGDVILSLNGIEIDCNQTIQDLSDQNVDNEVVYKIKRADKEIDLRMTPQIIEETGRGGIGVSIAETGIVRYSFFRAIWEGVRTTLIMTWIIIIAFYELIKGLVIGNGVSIEVGGPVRIAQITGDAVRMGFSYLINFSALLSINLAIINAFPFPALDGGRVVFLLVEKIQGHPVSKRIETAIHSIGFALLMVLIVLVTYQDIARFWQ